jgi:hypothetical protein
MAPLPIIGYYFENTLRKKGNVQWAFSSFWAPLDGNSQSNSSLSTGRLDRLANITSSGTARTFSFEFGLEKKPILLLNFRFIYIKGDLSIESIIL